MSDNDNYPQPNDEQLDAFELLCTRCGACCGSEDGDPCVHLQFDEELSVYYCDDYENRLGPQKTRNGLIFNCVPIIENIKRGAYHQNCSYRRFSK